MRRLIEDLEVAVGDVPSGAVSEGDDDKKFRAFEKSISMQMQSLAREAGYLAGMIEEALKNGYDMGSPINKKSLKFFKTLQKDMEREANARE